MKKIGIVLFTIICSLFFSSIGFAKEHKTYAVKELEDNTWFYFVCFF